MCHLKHRLRIFLFCRKICCSQDIQVFVFLMPCSDERQNGFKGLKIKRKFLQPFLTQCEHDCFCLETLKYFRFNCLRRFLKIKIFWFLKTVLRTLKKSFKKITRCSTDFLLFFWLKLKIIKANENNTNILYENYMFWSKRWMN